MQGRGKMAYKDDAREAFNRVEKLPMKPEQYAHLQTRTCYLHSCTVGANGALRRSSFHWTPGRWLQLQMCLRIAFAGGLHAFLTLLKYSTSVCVNDAGLSSLSATGSHA